ncbi:MAG TPA: redoxin family protein [Planctomycetota bacterium]|nr:redoxin family protein [Planctomycetota bacterium]
MQSRPARQGKAFACGCVFLTLFAVACAATDAVVAVGASNGNLAGRGAQRDGRQDGPWQFFHANGQVESAGSFANDVRDGPWQHWYSDGTLRMAGSYADDRQVGTWRFWHANGQLSCRGSYRVGREYGEWSFFHDNGRLRQRGCFLDARRELLWEEFDADGRRTAMGAYYHDQPIGTWLDETGAAAAVREYATPEGVQWVHEVWDDGSTRREGFVCNGAAEGLWLTRHRGGALRCIGTIRNGRAEGEWEARAGDGALLALGLVQDGQMRGTWSVGDPAGGRQQALQGRPCPPWDGTWSEASIVRDDDPLLAVAQWLAEVQSPLPAKPIPRTVAPAVTTAAAPTERLEAPTDPGQFTVRERDELRTLRRYYRDGFLPRHSGIAAEYGGAENARDLGGGDDRLANAVLGKRLPVTRFRTVDGGEFDLDTLRGRKVLLVVLRGFTAQVCVYCFAQTAELAPVTADLANLGCELVVLFPGSRSRLDAFRSACAREFGDSPAPYRLVYDPDLALGKSLGLEGNVVRPSSLLLDAAGVVRFAYVAESVKNVADRPPTQRLLDVVRRLDAP